MILIDAGPLVAVVDAGDPHHLRCLNALRTLHEPLATVWPAVSEAMSLLRGLPRGQQAVLEMLERGAVRILPLGADDLPRMRELIAKYVHRRMDVAAAALVRVAEREGLDTVFTLDRRGFEVYRRQGRRFRVLPGAKD